MYPIYLQDNTLLNCLIVANKLLIILLMNTTNTTLMSNTKVKFALINPLNTLTLLLLLTTLLPLP
jgi:hypothetical protein